MVIERVGVMVLGVLLLFVIQMGLLVVGVVYLIVSSCYILDLYEDINSTYRCCSEWKRHEANYEVLLRQLQVRVNVDFRSSTPLFRLYASIKLLKDRPASRLSHL